ncbi:GerA spore germination protein [Cohnella sp. OV330]|uniref:spore germination protein n=1 Tax=Cohnella sp. OV330 TaxID=1855288 RepID=UPI0008E69CB2|nr:spore germination protein [Cohnella sp. OV330]SFB39020.1 GerA spore germination protein [Cohnella sp. OV330]
MADGKGNDAGANAAEKTKPTLALVAESVKGCADCLHEKLAGSGAELIYFPTLVDLDCLQRDLIRPLSQASPEQLNSLLSGAPYRTATDLKSCAKSIMDGAAAVFAGQDVYLFDAPKSTGRKIEQSETETIITGPHDGFVEALEENLGVIRKRIRSPKLKSVALEVGEVAKTRAILLYVEGLANEQFVTMLTDRIQDIEIDGVSDANMLVQLIDENPNSLFPQYLTTERPDAVVSKLLGGRIAVILDGSPSVFSAPTAFLEFFSSPDDYYQRWPIGTALRILRLIGFLITICFTAFYVSVTTFHYEMIPHTMLLNLAESRSRVPFPPLIEALLMETTIELLREAGARLPTKIGQTIGIVGGIVIGQAAVQAGFTSNILIIAVAISAIASFVIPSYIMSASLRLIRFGLIVLAGILGNLGLIFGIGFLVVHMAGVTNLGTSYLTPIAPAKFMDILDTLVRGPFWALKKRPSLSRSPNKTRAKIKR